VTTIEARDGRTIHLPPHGAQRPPRRRRPRWFAPLLALVLLGLLASLLVLGDVLGRRWAEDQIAARVQTELGLDAPPAVDVTGTPFLTQVAARRLDAVHVTADSTRVTTEGVVVELQGVDLWLRGVTLRVNFSKATVADLAGQGRLSWPSVRDLTGIDLRWAGADAQGRGRITMQHDLEFQGLHLPITLTARPEIDPATRQLRFAEPTVAVSGFPLPADLVADLLSRTLRPIDLPLPAGLQIGEVRAEEAGLTIALTGTDVDLGGP